MHDWFVRIPLFWNSSPLLWEGFVVEIIIINHHPNNALSGPHATELVNIRGSNANTNIVLFVFPYCIGASPSLFSWYLHPNAQYLVYKVVENIFQYMPPITRYLVYRVTGDILKYGLWPHWWFVRPEMNIKMYHTNKC